jgi:hypothetical protein
MRRIDLVSRPTNMGRRATGDIPDAVRHRLYQEMLTNDLGRNRQIGRPHDDGRPDGMLDFLTRPFALIILCILIFGLTLGVLLWRDGAFDALFAPKSASVGHGSKAWLLGRNTRDRIEDTTPGAGAEPEVSPQSVADPRAAAPSPAPEAAPPALRPAEASEPAD